MHAIVDTCVLLDILIGSRPRHEQAKPLASMLQSGQIKAIVPVFAIFELQSAVNQERTAGGIEFNRQFTWLSTLKLHTVPIDDAFVERYLNPNLPLLKAADLVLLSMAFKERLPLVTEDQRLYDRAREVKVGSLKTVEFIERYSGPFL